MGCKRLTYGTDLRVSYGSKPKQGKLPEGVGNSLNLSRKVSRNRVDRGLYYYGARYYDPKVSNWLSVDPLAVDGAYLSGDVNYGYFNTRNIAPYTYTYNNPVRFTDPNGKWVIVLWWVGAAIAELTVTEIALIGASIGVAAYLSQNTNRITFDVPGRPELKTGTSVPDNGWLVNYSSPTRGIPNFNPGGGKKGLSTAIALGILGALELYRRNKSTVDYYIDKAKGLMVNFTSSSTDKVRDGDNIYTITKTTFDLKYKVRNGDNLTKIADKFGVSLEQLRTLNNISEENQNNIQKGDNLIIAQDTVVDVNKTQGVTPVRNDNIRLNRQEEIKRSR